MNGHPPHSPETSSPSATTPVAASSEIDRLRSYIAEQQRELQSRERLIRQLQQEQQLHHRAAGGSNSSSNVASAYDVANGANNGVLDYCPNFLAEWLFDAHQDGIGGSRTTTARRHHAPHPSLRFRRASLATRRAVWNVLRGMRCSEFCQFVVLLTLVCHYWSSFRSLQQLHVSLTSEQQNLPHRNQPSAGDLARSAKRDFDWQTPVVQTVSNGDLDPFKVVVPQPVPFDFVAASAADAAATASMTAVQVRHACIREIRRRHDEALGSYLNVTTATSGIARHALLVGK